jgi:hypothetical protein
LFLQDVNWEVLGFNATQQAAIAQVRQQFQNEVNGANQYSNGTANQNSTPASQNTSDMTPAKRWLTALQNADEQLRDLLGGQGYAAYEQQQYYAWYQPQVLANVDGGNLIINPDAFSME